MSHPARKQKLKEVNKEIKRLVEARIFYTRTQPHYTKLVQELAEFYSPQIGKTGVKTAIQQARGRIIEIFRSKVQGKVVGRLLEFTNDRVRKLLKAKTNKTTNNVQTTFSLSTQKRGIKRVLENENNEDNEIHNLPFKTQKYILTKNK